MPSHGNIAQLQNGVFKIIIQRLIEIVIMTLS